MTTETANAIASLAKSTNRWLTKQDPGRTERCSQCGSPLTPSRATPLETIGNVLCFAVMLAVAIPLLYFGTEFVRHTFELSFHEAFWLQPLERWNQE